MVRLSKIYTKTGDTGTTMLGDGSTVPKGTLRVEAYGTVDEANAAIGVARADLDDAHNVIDDALARAQNDLFDVGADLCVPLDANEKAGERLRVTPEQVAAVEAQIDAFNEPLEPLSSFILPGGSRAAASLHLARTVTRRAERLVARLVLDDPDRTNPDTLVYLNRLSDLLFVLARVVNRAGGGDVLWIPGANRDPA
ncbi:MAG: cob(I)yrinic acid a,c-diamide adenosyltransferase [Planctomycetota bacterium]